MRRVVRRMRLLHVANLQAYADLLKHDPEEPARLLRDLLIGVTDFFRDADAFAALQKTVVPELFAGRDATSIIRVWVPGCATGEEAYSIAILLSEHIATLPYVPRVQIFATDIARPALSVARAGRYPAAQLAGRVSQDRIERFFVPSGDILTVSKTLRKMRVFSDHSLLRDPPFSRIDMISCRNLLIYLDAEAQRRIIAVFDYALRPGAICSWVRRRASPNSATHLSISTRNSVSFAAGIGPAYASGRRLPPPCPIPRRISTPCVSR